MYQLTWYENGLKESIKSDSLWAVMTVAIAFKFQTALNLEKVKLIGFNGEDLTKIFQAMQK